MSKELDYLFAQMSNGCYDDPPRAISGWSAKAYADNKTGFAATVYKREGSDEVIIAYRGTDDSNDTLKADVAFANPLPDWDPQCTQALLLAEQVRKENPNATISVTGHSLGGGLAQVVSQAYGMHGITFDPAGAKNIVQSKEFAAYNSAHGLPAGGHGVPSNFENHLVYKSKISRLSGAHLGHTDIITGLGNITKGEAVKLGASKVGGPIVEGAYELSLRHSMDRIEKDMHDKVKGIIHPIVQNNTPDANKTLMASDLSGHSQSLIAQAQTHTRKISDERGTPWNDSLDNIAHSVASKALDKNIPEINLFAVNGTDVNFGYKDGVDLRIGSVNSIEAAQTDKSVSLAAMKATEQQQLDAAQVAMNNPTQNKVQTNAPSMT